MDIEGIVKLRKLQDQLVADLDFDLVSPGLLQYRVLNTEEYAAIRDISGDNKDKVESLLAKIATKDSSAVSRLSQALAEDYDWLAHSLQNTSVSPQELEEYKLKTNQLRDKVTGNVPSFDHNRVGNNSQEKHKSFSHEALQRPSGTESQGILMQGTRKTIHETQQSGFSGNGPQRQMCPDNQDQVRHPSDMNDTFPSGGLRPPGGSGKDILDRLPYGEPTGGWRLGGTYVSPPGSASSSGHNPLNSPVQSSSEGLNSPVHSSQSTGSNRSGFHSPVISEGPHNSPQHSSVFSVRSSPVMETTMPVPDRKRKVEEVLDEEITEDMIEFVMDNPRVMRRWTNLAHQIGLSNRVPVIQARIRNEGRDHDEHVGELLREWRERIPGEATRVGLVKILRSQNFNDTAGKLEDGSYAKRRKF